MILANVQAIFAIDALKDAYQAVENLCGKSTITMSPEGIKVVANNVRALDSIPVHLVVKARSNDIVPWVYSKTFQDVTFYVYSEGGEE